MSQNSHHFLALVSPDDEVYVASTAKSFRAVYKEHWSGKHLRSAQLFYGKRPRLFLLERVEPPAGNLAIRRILWSRHFHEAGYTVVDWADIQPYLDHPHPKDDAAYTSIQAFNLEELCAPVHDLACDFAFAPYPHTIKLEVSSEEWLDVQQDAADKGLPLDTYLRERFYDGSVQTLSLPELRNCEQQCRQVVLQSRYSEHKKLKYDIIFVDEVDKLAAKGNETRTAYNRGTQHSLLKLVEGTQLETEHGTVDTADLLFIFGGAFTGLQKKAIPVMVNPIGFMREPRAPEATTPHVTLDDFIRFGMEAELMGRVGLQVPLQQLTANELKKILLDSRLSLYRQYQQFFLRNGTQLYFSNAKLDGLVDQALAMGTGARALNALVEESVTPLLLHLAEGHLRRKEVAAHDG